MPETQHEIRPVALTHLEQCSEKRDFRDGGGHYAIHAHATIAIHHSLVGKSFKLRFPTIPARNGDYFLIPAELKIVHPDDGPARQEVSFATVKLSGAQQYVTIAEATTKDLKELITKYAFTRLAQKLTADAQDIVESAAAG